MGFEAFGGFEVVSTPENMVDHIVCAHCRELLFDRSVDTVRVVKRIVNFLIAHLGMYHPEEIPPEMLHGA